MAPAAQTGLLARVEAMQSVRILVAGSQAAGGTWRMDGVEKTSTDLPASCDVIGREPQRQGRDRTCPGGSLKSGWPLLAGRLEQQASGRGEKGRAR